jgi:pyruvate/2-oxoglutarate dehydrogenase complex dihydrolipoamide acyltransferase (E2) component
MSSPITQEVEQFSTTQMSVVNQAALIVVNSDKDAEDANKILVSMREAAARLEAKRVELKAPSLESCRRIDEFFKGPIERLTEAGKTLKSSINGYLDRKAAERKAEEDRLKAIADKERQRLEDEARRKEQEAAAARAKAEQEARDKQREANEADARRRAAEAAGNTEAAKKAAAETARLEEQARQAIAKGETKAASLEETASVKRETAAAVPSPASMMPEAVKPKGFVTRKKYDAEVVSVLELVKAIAEGKVPVSLVEVNMTALRQRATADKEGFNVPGCRLKVTQV